MNRRLIADIGGTNARFALVDESGQIGTVLRLAAAGHPRFEDVLESALQRLPGAEGVPEVAIAAAGPLGKGEIAVTNLPWRVVSAWVSERLGGAAVRLLNDLEAVALALPRLRPADLAPLREAAAPARAPRIAINAGTGFGAATAVPAGGDWLALAGEPGHMRLAAVTEAEWRLLGHAHSVEDLLSGRGLAALYRRLAGIGGRTDAAEVFARAGFDAAAAEAVETFASCLGRVAGDLVLASGAWGGAYLCGGLLTASHGRDFERAFLAAFDDKGAMAARVARVPVYRITASEPALAGLAALRMGQA